MAPRTVPPMAVRELWLEGYRSIRALRFSLAPVRPLSGAAEAMPKPRQWGWPSGRCDGCDRGL